MRWQKTISLPEPVYETLRNQKKKNETSKVDVACSDTESVRLSSVIKNGFAAFRYLNDGKERPTGNVCTPGTHINMQNKKITKHCINSSSKTYNGDQWIDLEILVIKDSIITHKINGKEVLTYSKPQIGGEYNSLINKDGEPLVNGYISLQSESHPIEFRNINLMNLYF